MSLEANKQLCRDYFTAFLARDTKWMAEHIAPGFVRHDPGLPFEVRSERKTSVSPTLICNSPP